jgi:hypothetical protein
MAKAADEFNQDADYEVTDPDYDQGSDPDYGESSQDANYDVSDPDAQEASQEWYARKQK